MAAEGISYITDSNGNPKVWSVEHNDNGLWLNSNYANPDNFCNGDKIWVFARKYLCFFRQLAEVLF